ncbi:MAG: hypothetical protein ACK528_02365, partial [Alphaproteobacteria bacterium]
MQTLDGKKYLTEVEAAMQLGMSVDALRQAREKYHSTPTKLAFEDRGRWKYQARKVLAYQELINGRIDDEEFARVATATPRSSSPQPAAMDSPLSPPASAQSSPPPSDDLGEMLAAEPDPLPTSSTVTTAGQFPGVFTPPRQATPAPSFPSPTPRSAASGVGVRPATAPSPPLPTLLQPQPRMSSRSPTTAPAATQRSMRGVGALGLGLAAGALGYGLGASGRSSMQSPLTPERDGTTDALSRLMGQNTKLVDPPLRLDDTTEDLVRLMDGVNGGGGGGRVPVLPEPPRRGPISPETVGNTAFLDFRGGIPFSSVDRGMNPTEGGSTYGATNYSPGAGEPPTYSTMGYIGPVSRRYYGPGEATGTQSYDEYAPRSLPQNRSP